VWTKYEVEDKMDIEMYNVKLTKTEQTDVQFQQHNSCSFEWMQQWEKKQTKQANTVL
jgi:hypothetical protein